MSYFRMGRLGGINIRVHWSWFLIMFLVSWSLSLTFGQIHPDWPIRLRWGMATLAGLLFFGSILAHELAHSLVALSRGIPVSSITLYMFGGVSIMQREPSSPAEELAITIVGPLTSLFLGAVCLVVGAGSAAVTAETLTTPASLAKLQPVSTALAWLGSVNILIGFFNLIPAFPLDGGRIVRSLIWAISNEARRATRWATWIGQAIALALILGGVGMLLGMDLPVLGRGLLNGIWLIFIGLFLVHAARMGNRQSMVDDRLAALPVRSVMRTRVPAISSGASLGDLLNQTLSHADGHALFVTEGQDVVGLVAMRDLKRSLRGQWATATVGDIMTRVSDLQYVSADEDIVAALDRLQRFELRQIPVMLDNRIVGLLHRKDVHHLLQHHSRPGP